MKKCITTMILIVFVLNCTLQGAQIVHCAQNKMYSVKEFTSLQLGMSLEHIYSTIGIPNDCDENSATYQVENSMKLKLYFDSQDLLVRAAFVSLKGMEIQISFGEKISYVNMTKRNIDISSFEKPHDIEEFGFLEAGMPMEEIQKKVGMPDYYTGTELRDGVYVLNNGCRLHIDSMARRYRMAYLRLEFEDVGGFYVSFQEEHHLWENEEPALFLLDSFSNLKKYMNLEEVYSLFGPPDKVIVCGVVYNLGLDKELVLFVNRSTNTLKSLAIKDATGSYCFIEISNYYSRIGKSNLPIYLDNKTMEYIKTTPRHSLKKFAQLKQGMSRDEIIEIVGEPDFYYGNLPGVYAYILSDENLLELIVKEDSLIEVALSFKDLSRCTISFNEFGYIDIY